MTKPKLLFVYDSKHEVMDGLWAALNLLEEDFEITRLNMVDVADLENADEDTNFILAWGAFHSKPEEATRLYKQHYPKIKIGLCIGGNANPPYDVDIWDILFYETRWYYKEFLQWYE